MSILSENDFNSIVANLLEQAEGIENNVYYDGEKHASIGIGMNS